METKTIFLNENFEQTDRENAALQITTKYKGKILVSEQVFEMEK